MNQIRKILSTELPQVLTDPMNPASAKRAANAQELLSMGIKALGGDYYDCLAGAPACGTVLSSGAGKARFDALPAGDKPSVLVARVIRSTTPTVSMKKQCEDAVARGEFATVLDAARERVGRRAALTPTVKVSEILATDVVETTDQIPHQWAGE